MNLNKKNLFIIGSCLVAFFVILTIGIVVTNRQGKPEVVAKVGDQVITKPEVDLELSTFKNLVLATAADRDAATKYLVDCRIASLESEKNSILVSDEEIDASIKSVIGGAYNDYSDQQQQITKDHTRCELTKQKSQELEVTSASGDYLALNILSGSDAKKAEDAAKKIASELNTGKTAFAEAKTSLEADPVYGTDALKKYSPVISATFDKYYFQNNIGIFSDSGLKKDTVNALNDAGAQDKTAYNFGPLNFIKQAIAAETKTQKLSGVKVIAAKQTLSKTPADNMDRWVVVAVTNFSSGKYSSIPEYQQAKYKEYNATYKSSESNKNVNLAKTDVAINTNQTNWFDKNTYYVKLSYLDKTGTRQPINLKPSIKESIYVTDSLEVKKSNNFTPLGNGVYVTQEGIKTPTMIAILNAVDSSVAENFPDDTFVKDGYWQWLRKDGSSEKEVKAGNKVYDTATLNEVKNNGVVTINEFLWVPKYQIVPTIALVGPTADALVALDSVNLVAQVTNTELDTQTKVKFRYKLTSEKTWQESLDWTPRFFGDNRVNREYNIANLKSGEKYEWQAKAIDQNGVESDWALSSIFYTVEEKQKAEAACKMEFADKLLSSSTTSSNITLTGKGENIDKYVWDFGDGSDPADQVNTAQVEHKYTEDGPYTASLSGYKNIKSGASSWDNTLIKFNLKEKSPADGEWIYCGTKNVPLNIVTKTVSDATDVVDEIASDSVENISDSSNQTASVQSDQQVLGQEIARIDAPLKSCSVSVGGGLSIKSQTNDKITYNIRATIATRNMVQTYTLYFPGGRDSNTEENGVQHTTFQASLAKTNTVSDANVSVKITGPENKCSTAFLLKIPKKVVEQKSCSISSMSFKKLSETDTAIKYRVTYLSSTKGMKAVYTITYPGGKKINTNDSTFEISIAKKSTEYLASIKITGPEGKCSDATAITIPKAKSNTGCPSGKTKCSDGSCKASCSSDPGTGGGGTTPTTPTTPTETKCDTGNIKVQGGVVSGVVGEYNPTFKVSGSTKIDHYTINYGDGSSAIKNVKGTTFSHKYEKANTNGFTVKITGYSSANDSKPCGNASVKVYVYNCVVGTLKATPSGTATAEKGVAVTFTSTGSKNVSNYTIDYGVGGAKQTDTDFAKISTYGGDSKAYFSGVYSATLKGADTTGKVCFNTAKANFRVYGTSNPGNTSCTIGNLTADKSAIPALNTTAQFTITKTEDSSQSPDYYVVKYGESTVSSEKKSVTNKGSDLKFNHTFKELPAGTNKGQYTITIRGYKVSSTGTPADCGSTTMTLPFNGEIKEIKEVCSLKKVNLVATVDSKDKSIVHFKVTGSTTATVYHMSYGDGGVGGTNTIIAKNFNSRDVSHKYDVKGVYTVSLSGALKKDGYASKPCGDGTITDKKTIQVSITAGPSTPQAACTLGSFVAEPQTGKAPLKVNFSSKGNTEVNLYQIVYDVDGNIVKSESKGVRSKDVTFASYTYKNETANDIKVKARLYGYQVFGENMVSCGKYKEITITVKPGTGGGGTQSCKITSITPVTTDYKIGESVTLHATAAKAKSYGWSISDPDSAGTAPAPTWQSSPDYPYTFADKGNYKISVSASSEAYVEGQIPKNDCGVKTKTVKVSTSAEVGTYTLSVNGGNTGKSPMKPTFTFQAVAGTASDQFVLDNAVLMLTSNKFYSSTSPGYYDYYQNLAAWNANPKELTAGIYQVYVVSKTSDSTDLVRHTVLSNIVTLKVTSSDIILDGNALTLAISPASGASPLTSNFTIKLDPSSVSVPGWTKTVKDDPKSFESSARIMVTGMDVSTPTRPIQPNNIELGFWNHKNMTFKAGTYQVRAYIRLGSGDGKDGTVKQTAAIIYSNPVTVTVQ